MNETRVNETKPKKMVSRNVAVALGMICIIVIVGLGGAMAYYVSIHSHPNSEYDALQSQVNDLYNISILNKTITWVSHQNLTLAPNTYFSWTEFETYLAGYVVIAWEQSTVSNCYAQVIWQDSNVQFDQTGYSGPVNYNNRINFGNGTIGHFVGVFTVLPTINSGGYLEIRVGNNDTVSNAIGNVSITFYY